ncbi:hypothetical protein BHT94_08910 [Bacillus licheniformis]|nr:hypothetical protein BHT94_08910 [Bacillus licheniformis]
MVFRPECLPHPSLLRLSKETLTPRLFREDQSCLSAFHMLLSENFIDSNKLYRTAHHMTGRINFEPNFSGGLYLE